MRTAATVLLLLLANAAHSDVYEEITSKAHAVASKALVERFPAATVDVELRPIDRRLNLQSCSDLRVAPHGAIGAGRVHLEARCMAPKPWRVYLSAQANVLVEVLVARRPLARGERISDADVRLERKNLQAVRGQTLSDAAHVRGYASKRNVKAGEVLVQNLLRPLPTVRRGEIVALTARVGAAQITTQAEALSDGQAGQQIQAKNLASGRVVRAWVHAPGRLGTQPQQANPRHSATQIAKSS